MSGVFTAGIILPGFIILGNLLFGVFTAVGITEPPHFSGTAYHEDIETKTHAAAASENELGKEINWPEDFFFGLPFPFFISLIHIVK